MNFGIGFTVGWLLAFAAVWVCMRGHKPMTEKKSEALHQRINRKWPCESLDASVAECLTLLHNAGWFGRKLSSFELIAIESTMRILRDREPK